MSLAFPVVAPMTDAILKDAAAHAIREFPKESCGLIVAGAYVPCFNFATLPEQDFNIDGQTVAKYLAAGTLEGVVHSHTTATGQAFPSGLDMQQQIATALPWAIIYTDGKDAGLACVWGDTVPVAPIIGRVFRHGVHDCYSLLRDTFRVGRDELAKQGIGWPHASIAFQDFPRRDAWWQPDKKSSAPAQDLYMQNFAAAGFKQISRVEAGAGDVFLASIGTTVTNHAAVMIEGGLMMHHFSGRLSQRDVAGLWRKSAKIWLRHREASNA